MHLQLLTGPNELAGVLPKHHILCGCLVMQSTYNNTLAAIRRPRETTAITAVSRPNHTRRHTERESQDVMVYWSKIMRISMST